MEAQEINNFEKLPIWNPENLVLDENQWLLKVRAGNLTGFASKLTQKKVLAKTFDEWGISHWRPIEDYPKLPIYLLTETYRSGWRFVNVRCGKSQEWAILMHPLGFTLEIYLTNFIKLILKETLVNGELVGEYMWKDNKLIKL